MFGRLAAGLIVVGLAIGVWLVWPASEGVPATSTLPVGTTVSSSSEPAITTTTPPDSTTESATVEIIDTVEEAEQLLRNLWFGWFEGIYLEDEDRIKEVVASQNQLDAAVAAFGTIVFDSAPTSTGITTAETEILLSEEGCAVVWGVVEVSDFTSVQFSGVHVFREVDDQWKFVSLWEHPGDLWEADCRASLSS